VYVHVRICSLAEVIDTAHYDISFLPPQTRFLLLWKLDGETNALKLYVFFDFSGKLRRELSCMLLTRMNLRSVEIKTKTVFITRNLISFHPKETEALEIYPCPGFFFSREEFCCTSNGHCGY